MIPDALQNMDTLCDWLFSVAESLEGRGNKKFGDRCEFTVECGFRGSVCDPGLKSCQCLPHLTATNHIDKCGQGQFHPIIFLCDGNLIDSPRPALC